MRQFTRTFLSSEGLGQKTVESLNKSNSNIKGSLNEIQNNLESVLNGLTNSPAFTVNDDLNFEVKNDLICDNDVSIDGDVTHSGDFYITGSTYGIDHGEIYGRTDDDHSIYALLAGRSGGQTLKGGTGSGDDLTLQSTNHATKGSILFGNSAYDEVNNRLGIGVSPSVNLHIQSVAGSAVKEYLWAGDGTADAELQIGQYATISWSHKVLASDGDYTFGIDGGQEAYKIHRTGTNTVYQSWSNAGTEKMRLDATGLGIGISPSYKLDVKDTTADWVANFFNDGNSAGYGGIRVQCGADDQSSGAHYYFAAYDGDGGAEGYLRVASGTFELIQASSEKKKTNIKDTDINALEILNNLKVRSFARRAKEKTENKETPLHSTGFIAEEVQKIFPDMVSEDPNGDLFISESRLISVLVKGIQELRKEIEELKNGT